MLGVRGGWFHQKQAFHRKKRGVRRKGRPKQNWRRVVLEVVLKCGKTCSDVNSLARPRTQHDSHHDTKVIPEAATAVIELLMMGGKTPETC
jgi:hypothetical protein